MALEREGGFEEAFVGCMAIIACLILELIAMGFAVAIGTFVEACSIDFKVSF